MGQSQKITPFLTFTISIGLVGWAWGYQDTEYHTAYGDLCKGNCNKHGYDYIWCTTETGWDYCSLTPDSDYKYNACRDDHRCGKYGKSYTWCYNKAGSWGYCGLQVDTEEPKMMSYISAKYQSECRDECLYDESGTYFWCNTDKGWDYCSPLPDVTCKNEPCRSDHSCDTHGNSYTWCWIDSNYDYCGVVKAGECRYSTTGHNKVKNQSNVVVLVCTQSKGEHKLETKFYLEPEQTQLANGNSVRRELTTLIAGWKNGYLFDYATSHVLTTENLRIDLQGLVTKDNRQYYWVDMHMNSGELPQSGSNTIVAQVLIPFENTVPSRHTRMALAESFRRRARITLDVTTAESD